MSIWRDRLNYYISQGWEPRCGYRIDLWKGEIRVFNFVHPDGRVWQMAWTRAADAFFMSHMYPKEVMEKELSLWKEVL